jgi:signal transduction histidine kinase
VHDDGTGCRCPGASKGSFNLDELEASAELIGGHLCVDQHDQHGTTIALWMPCRQAGGSKQ